MNSARLIMVVYVPVEAGHVWTHILVLTCGAGIIAWFVSREYTATSRSNLGTRGKRSCKAYGSVYASQLARGLVSKSFPTCLMLSLDMDLKGDT